MSRILILVLLLTADTSPKKGGAIAPETTGLLRTIVPHNSAAEVVAFGGRYLATGTGSGVVVLTRHGSWKRVRNLEGHTAGVTSVALNRAGTRLVSGSSDGTVRVWNIQTGRELYQRSGPANTMSKVAVAPDGKSFVATTRDFSLRTYDMESGKELKTFDGRAMPFALSYSPDGLFVAAATSDGQFRIWDATKGEVVQQVAGMNAGYSVAWSRNGKLVFLGDSTGAIRVFDRKSGEFDRTFRGHTSTVTGLATTPGGRYLISSGNDFTVRIWDIRKGEETQLSHHKSYVRGVAVGPGGRYIASACMDWQVKIWGRRNGGMKDLPEPAFLGVTVSDNAALEGITIDTISAGSAAETHDLRIGDTLTKINGEPLRNITEARARISAHLSGETVEFTVVRDGAESRKKVKLGHRGPND